jgi:hypothetical protein
MVGSPSFIADDLAASLDTITFQLGRVSWDANTVTVRRICKPSLLPSSGSANSPLMKARADEFPMNSDEF